MADTKQPQLNGAYYGPAIPPPSQPPPRHGGAGRRCCCCLFSFCWKLILAVVVFVVAFFLVFWAVVQPHSFKLHVTDAKLTQFNYTDSNTLHYNLVLNFTARNPNKKLSIYYDQVEAHAYYDDVRFASVDVITWRNAFRQHTKSTDQMSGVFVGQQVMVVDKDQNSEFEEERKNGVFDIDVRLNFNFRFELGGAIGGGTKAKAKCELEVPLSSKSTTGVSTVFQPTQCHVSL